MELENKWWLRWSKMEQNLIERRSHQELTTQGTEENLWKNQSHPPDWFQEGLLCSFCATGESKLCVLTRVGPCRAFDVLGSAAQLRAPPQLCFLIPSPTPSPAKLQPFLTRSLWMDFFVHFISTTWHLMQSGLAWGSVVLNTGMKNTIFIQSSSKDIQVHEIPGFFHWFFKKKVKALSVHSQAEVSQEGYSQDNCGRRSRAGLSSVLLRKK